VIIVFRIDAVKPELELKAVAGTADAPLNGPILEDRLHVDIPPPQPPSLEDVEKCLQVVMNCDESERLLEPQVHSERGDDMAAATPTILPEHTTLGLQDRLRAKRSKRSFIAENLVRSGCKIGRTISENVAYAMYDETPSRHEADSDYSCHSTLSNEG